MLLIIINVIRSKLLGNFPKFRPKNSELSILTENWCSRYLGGADTESGLRFLKFRSQNPFLGKFVPKKPKFSILTENWRTEYIEDSVSFFFQFPTLNPFLGKLGPKTSKLSILFEN